MATGAWRTQKDGRLCPHSSSGQACPQGHTNINPDWGLLCRRGGAAAAALRPLDLIPSQPGGAPTAGQGPSPQLIGHCWTDTGGKKQEKACVCRGEGSLSRPTGSPGGAPPALRTAWPSGHRLELRGPACPAERRQGPLVVLVRLGLALGPLGLRVGGRVGLLHRHGPAQVVALPQELGLRVEAEAALAQDHARAVLLGARAVAGLQRGQVRGVALAQELRRGQASGQRARDDLASAPRPRPSITFPWNTPLLRDTGSSLPYKGSPPVCGQLSASICPLSLTRVFWTADGVNLSSLLPSLKFPKCSVSPLLQLLGQGTSLFSGPHSCPFLPVLPTGAAEPCYSKRGRWTSSTSRAWTLVRQNLRLRNLNLHLPKVPLASGGLCAQQH